jgi:hypothetical protein
VLPPCKSAPRFVPNTLHGKARADVQSNVRDTGIKLTAGIAAAFAALLTTVEQ